MIFDHNIRKPAFMVRYQGMDVTAEFGGYAIEVEYTDNRHGESDECQLSMHNSSGEWMGAYAPQDGDVMEVWYGYSDAQVFAGRFTVDEYSLTGGRSGDRITIKALATSKTEALRTKNTTAFEDQNLSDIVQKIATKHDLKVDGEIEDIHFDRVTQNDERDLEFLKRLADDYGHYFSVKGKILVFTSRDGLRAKKPVFTIDRTIQIGQHVKSYDLSSEDHKAAKKAEIKYSHPRRKTLVGSEASSVDDLGLVTASGDVVKIDARVENEDQAKRVAKSRLDKQNSEKTKGSLTLVGIPILVAGAVVELKNFGLFDGPYLIIKSRHKQSRSGYETSIDVERITDKNVSDGNAAKKKTKKKGNSAKPSIFDGAEDLGTVQADGSVSK